MKRVKKEQSKMTQKRITLQTRKDTKKKRKKIKERDGFVKESYKERKKRSCGDPKF